MNQSQSVDLNIKKVSNVQDNSMFTDQATAETVIDDALTQIYKDPNNNGNPVIIDDQEITNERALEKWLDGSLTQTKSWKFEFDYSGNTTIGRGATRADQIVTDRENAHIALVKKPDGTFYILTAFPT